MKIRLLLPLFATAVSLHTATTLLAQTAAPEAPTKEAQAGDEKGDKAWSEIIKQLQRDATPPQGADEATINQWRETESARMLKLAEEVRAFYTGHPKHPEAMQARGLEMNALMMASRLGGEKAETQVVGIIEERLKDKDLPADVRFNYSAALALRKATSPQEFEAATRELAKEFPDHPMIPQFLFLAARQSSGEHAKKLIEEVINHKNAKEEVKAQAKELLASMDLQGKPLDLKFKALDGSEVDLAKLKGKVVLIDFWATWCGPCIHELPHLKELYAKYKEKGFEIIGISLDNNDKAALEAFLKKENMTWPQYFDGKGFGSEMARRFNINAIPTVWLVDKKGILRDLNARQDTDKKVADLLAE